jgi:hypothetical protein
MSEARTASPRDELLGWAATMVFIALSYALRRYLDRRA